MPAEFTLDSRLEGDTHRIASWPLCDVLMMNDAQYPWFILVPRVADATELFQLSDAQRQQLDAESTYLGRRLMAIFQGEKLNVAALGNVVAQLHIHHIVRFKNDPSWPAPVWGKFPLKPFESSELEDRLASVSELQNPDWT